jgi:hypothetical protein
LPETTISVRANPTNKLRIDPTEITAQGGPVYPRLIVPLHLDFGVGQELRPFLALGAECGLFLADLKISDATPSVSSLTVTYACSTIWNLEFPLDPHRVKEIEARRHGNLKLRFDFAFVFGHLDRVARLNNASQGPMDVLVGLEKSTAQIYLEVPQSDWVGKALPALGSSAFFIVEIPAGTGHTAQAWALIEKAESAFGQWDTKAVFAHCREAGGALTSLIEKRYPQNAFLRDERWGRAIKEFNHLTSLGLHLEEIKANGKYSADQVRIEKADAECVLIFAKALAKYAEELIR